MLFSPNLFISKAFYKILQQLLDLKYLYKKPDSPLLPNISFLKIMTFLPPDTLGKLLEMTKTGDINAIKQKVTDMEQEGDAYQTFIIKARELTDNFQLDE